MSLERNSSLKALRPKIEILEKSNQSEFEHFQNTVLRQICKFQNEILLEFISFYIQSKNKNFSKHAPTDKLKFIESLFSKDTSFKNTLKGLVIGHFTKAEFQFYSLNLSEINKRIIQLIKTRFLSQFKY
ncbi:MAG: hypothetical protein ACPG4Y_02290 [Chitinophagales bacterium]